MPRTCVCVCNTKTARANIDFVRRVFSGICQGDGGVGEVSYCKRRDICIYILVLRKVSKCNAYDKDVDSFFTLSADKKSHA